MKKRYSNFHRARKWHRKFRNALYSGYIQRTEHYSDLFYKYFDKSTHHDGMSVLYRGQGDKCVLYIETERFVCDHIKHFIKCEAMAIHHVLDTGHCYCDLHLPKDEVNRMIYGKPAVVTSKVGFTPVRIPRPGL